MSGRDLNPGERGQHGDLRDSRAYLSRPVRGQIQTVTPEDGKIQVYTHEVISSRELTVPVLWFSAQGRQSAWGRYMPMGTKRQGDTVYGGEMVHITYRNDGTPVFAGYDATATKTGEAGWTELEAAKKAGTPGFSTFRSLKRGEFDFKSSGDAYIHGSNVGTLSLYGGQAFVKVEKEAYRISGKAGSYVYRSGASTIRFGTVYRKATPASVDESPVALATIDEFMVDVNHMLPAGIPAIQSRAKLHFGNIIDDLTLIPKISSYGLPVRGSISLGDVSDVLEVFKLEIDAGGNVAWEQKGVVPSNTQIKVANTTIDITGLLGQFYISMTGVPPVSVAIANHLQILYETLKAKLDAFDLHQHPTGMGPSGPPTPTIMAPAWMPVINSTKMVIPDG